MIQALQNFRTYHVACEFYRECKAVKLSPSLRDQLTRATESIVLTLAEGSAKPTAKDRTRFYSMSLGSFRESQAILSLVGENKLLERFDHLGAFLYRLSRSATNSY
jgi:four helix bundle protein